MSDRGRSVIGPVDEPGRKTLGDELFIASELLRGHQLEPDEVASDLVETSDFDVFGD